MPFFKRVWKSIINPASYEEVLDQSLGKTLKYVLLLFVITFLIIWVVASIRYVTWVNIVTDALDTEVPNFEFGNHILTVDGPQPIVSKTGNYTVVVDTTGAIDPEYIEAIDGNAMVLTDDRIVMRDGLEERALLYSEVPFEFTKTQLLDGISSFLTWMLIFSGIFAFGWGLGGKLLTALILGLVGLIMDSVLTTRLRFGQIYNVCAHALTGSILLAAIKTCAFPRLPAFGWAYWGLALIYLYLALASIRKASCLTPAGGQLEPAGPEATATTTQQQRQTESDEVPENPGGTALPEPPLSPEI